MSKTGKNFAKKQLKINTDNFGFSFCHYKNKSSHLLSITQKTEPSAPLNTNNNINNQYNSNNINIINININNNANTNTNTNSNTIKNKNKNINSNTNININYKSKNPFINFIKKKINLNQSKKNETKRAKLETNPNNIDCNSIKSNRIFIKEKNISNSTSRTETETNIFKNSCKINNNNKKKEIMEPPPKQMIISYFDVKNILSKKNDRYGIQKKNKMQNEEKNQIKKKKKNSMSNNKDKNKIIKNSGSNLSNNIKKIKHQSEENLLKFRNNFIYRNKIKSIKQSKSFLNRHKFDILKRNLNNNDIISLVYLKTSGNIPIESNKRIRHYYTKNDISLNSKNKITEKEKKHEKNYLSNCNINTSPSGNNNITNKSQKFYIFQKYFLKKSNNNILNCKYNINISKSKSSNKNSNNEINKNFNLNNINKNENGNQIVFNNNSLEEYFENEIKKINFKNPEELHFLYIKIFQAGNEIKQNFENNDF